MFSRVGEERAGCLLALGAVPNRLFFGPRFVLARAGIRRHVVQIEAIEKDDLGLGRTSERLLSAGPQSGIKSPFFGPRYALARAGIRRHVVQIKAI